MDVVMGLTHRLLSGSQENPLDEPLKLYLVLLDTERVTGLRGRVGGGGNTGHFLSNQKPEKVMKHCRMLLLTSICIIGRLNSRKRCGFLLSCSDTD